MRKDIELVSSKAISFVHVHDTQKSLVEALKNTCNMVSVSGGKDSTATLLLAIESGAENMFPVFADTGNEHELTYEYLHYLEQKLGIAIKRVKADFSADIDHKREKTLAKWAADGVDESLIEKARQVLVPTGVPFLDLCMWKGRFPSSQARFCTDELKVLPITEQVVFPLLKEFEVIESWQGIRWDESDARRGYVEREGIEPDPHRVFAFRPILSWSAEDVFAFHKKHGIEANPLYKLGMGRVGCMPCINARKNELREIAQRFPEVIRRLIEWEALVSAASKRGSGTFFLATNDPTVEKDEEIGFETHGIERMVEWAMTGRGGRQVDWIVSDAIEQPACSSIYGLCD